tara:strand:+ start:2848 stop:3075 length:228 start_codon:yes stop_codon:yes gene_type:complete
MKYFLLILSIFFFNNCSLNNNSKFWTEDNIKNITFKNKLENIMKKSNNLLSMTFDEYQIYINEYNKNSKFPDISK